MGLASKVRLLIAHQRQHGSGVIIIPLPFRRKKPESRVQRAMQSDGHGRYG